MSRYKLITKLFSSVSLFFLFLVISNSSAFAATYYVATTGNDSNTTTQAQNSGTPWLTLQHAEDTATNGDIVHVAAGTYVENGASAGWYVTKAISWIADGTVTVKGTEANTRPLYLYGSGATSINGFTFDSETTRSYGVYFANNTSNKTLTNCTISKTNNAAILVNTGSSNIIFDTCTITSDNTGNYGISAGGPLTFRNGTINFNGLYPVQDVNGGNTTISNNTITTNVAYASADNHTPFTLQSTGGTKTFSNNIINLTAVKSVVFAANGSSGTLIFSGNTVNVQQSKLYSVFSIDLGTWAPTISNNTISVTGANQSQHVVSVTNQNNANISGNTITTSTTVNSITHIQVLSTGSTLTGTIIDSNILTHNTSNASGYVIFLGTENPSATDGMIVSPQVTNNTITANATSGNLHIIMCGYVSNCLVKYNKVFSAGAGYGIVVGTTAVYPYTTGGVFYNLLYGSMQSGIRVGGGTGLKIYNNTISINSNIYSAIYITPTEITNDPPTNIKIKNNIIVNSNATTSLIRTDSTGLSGFESDNNVLYAVGGGNIGTISSTNYSSLSTWQGLGYDTNSVSSNPLFLNTGTNDYRLQRTSPSINLGTDLSFIRDFVNTFVPQGALPDAGAYEYIPLTVTINQKSDQIDPTTGSTINYTVVFSESVSDFATGDVTLSGTAGATTATVTGSGTTYNVAVSGMTSSGTVIATIAADVATGATSNTNAVSTSTDNTITYDITAPAGGSISYSNTSQTSTNVDLTVSDGTDPNSGINTQSRLIQRKVAPLVVDTCGSFGSFSTISATGTYPNFVDSSVSAGSCYMYQYLVSDNAGNQQTYTSSNVVKVIYLSGPTSCSSTTPTGTAPWLNSAVSNNSNSVNLQFVNYQIPIDHFVLEYGTESGKYIFGSDNIGGKGTTSYVVNSLAPNTTYFFRIRTGNDCATGSWSNEISVKTKSNFSINNLDITDSEIKTTPSDSKLKTKNETKDVGFEGYVVNIKVLDNDKNPVVGATVTLHSTPRETTTDENGVAHFTDVESGDHKVLIAYNNFEGEQSINLSGDTKEFNLNITVTEKKVMFSKTGWIIVGIMALVIVSLIFILLKKKRV